MVVFRSVPLPEQTDGGLGYLAESYQAAADALDGSPARPVGVSILPPRCLLYRHAVELYLKSIVTLIHRVQKRDYGPYTHTGPPYIHSGSKWERINRVHSVRSLYRYLETLLTQEAEPLLEATGLDWSRLPPELKSWIDEIDRMDGTGTFFRYPLGVTNPDAATRDMTKSPWWEVQTEYDDSVPVVTAGESIVISGGNGVADRTYAFDESQLFSYVSILRRCAEVLGGAMLSIRWGIAAGW
jgi:hypothetical protein